jgi:hypothetical protein
LITHRRAVVDAPYVARTGEQFQLGTELVITPEELKNYVKLSAKAGIALINQGIELLKPA